MAYEERLQSMIDKGVLNAQQAQVFAQSLGAMPTGADVPAKGKIPLAGLVAALAAALVAGGIALGAATAGPAGPEAVQSVKDAMNTAGATGGVGAGASALVTLFLLAGIPLSAVLLFLASAYNKVVAFDGEAAKAEGYVAAALQRRRELIPELQSVVKQAMVFEETLQASVTGQRGVKAADLGDALAGASAETDAITPLAPVLSGLVEAYPQLKSHENILQLQSELARVEDGLMVARNINSAAVADLNAVSRGVFGSLAARMAGVRERRDAAVSNA